MRRIAARGRRAGFVAHLRMLAATRPADTALIVVRSDGELTLDYAELDLRVRAVAAELQTQFEPGERVILLLGNDEHYVVGFLACLYAGLIAVPAFPPQSIDDRHLGRLRGIASDAQARCALVSSGILAKAEKLGALFAGVEVIAVDAIPAARADNWKVRGFDERDVVFLQYTSGSTADPKGVIVDHGNLLANERAISGALQTCAADVFVSWLPLFHDMGLVGGLFQPIYNGIPLVLTSPAYFLERPVRWLELISRHGGTISGGPDFAYRLCLERVSDAQVKTLDLSKWRVAFSGAEPVRHDTLQAFARRFESAGFRASAIYPCYGLAEATLFVTGGQPDSGMTARTYSRERLAKGRATTSRAGTTLVACGTPHKLHDLRIVDPETGERQPNACVGEIWISGPSVSRGYWQRPRETAATFVEKDGRQWLRSGDLGFVQHRQVYITSRLKDLIILRGQNVIPQDLERAVESNIEAVRKGRVAAFAVNGAAGEGIGIAVEVSRGLQALVPADRLVATLSEVISSVCQEPVAVAILLNPGGLPKTSSGKVRRSACREGWSDGTLDAYAVWEYGRFALGGTEPAEIETPQTDTERALAAIWRVVLNSDRVTRDATFFASGGNSIAAAQIASRVSEQWQMDFPVKLVFEIPRLGDLAAEIDRRMKVPETSSYGAIHPLNPETRARPVPLSHAQQRLWFLWRLDPHNTAYHISGELRFTGWLDVAALRSSFQTLVARHESLRTVFQVSADGEAAQVVLANISFDIPLIDAAVAHEKRRVQETPFDLLTGPLLRVAVMRTADAEWRLLITIHHIISDGWSMQLMLDELCAHYAAHCEGRKLEQAPLPIQYLDYAIWQRNWLEQGEGERQLAWWRRQLGEEHPVLELPVDHPRRAATAYRTARIDLEIPQDLMQALRASADECGGTLFAVLLAAFQVVLHRYTGVRDIRIGVPIANRRRTEVERVLGFFVNTLVLRSLVDDTATLARVLENAARTLRDAQANQDLPFEHLVEALHPGRDLTQSPFFRVVMNHQVVDETALRHLPGLHLEGYSIAEQAAQFELALRTIESRSGALRAQFTYAAELFEPESIRQLSDHYLAVLRLMVERPLETVGAAPLLSEHEWQRLQGWGTPARQASPVHEPVHRQIEQRARQVPDGIAVIIAGSKTSYGELSARSSQLAHRLIAMGVKPETRVGIAIERSTDMIVALLAILKAGGAYVPLDTEYPPERSSYMMHDSGITLLLTQRKVLARVPEVKGVRTLLVDEIDVSAESDRDPNVSVHAANLAYVLYTSGSTGRPKGVAVAHGVLSMHLAAIGTVYALEPQERALQFASIGFDAAGEQWMIPLLAGATLVLLNREERTFSQIERLIRQHAISVLYMPPAYFRQLVRALEGRVLATRLCIAGGEAWLRNDFEAVQRHLAPRRLVNAYGPTEAVITPTCWCAGSDTTVETACMPIGLPVADRVAYVLDVRLNPVPRGVAGELYLGGDGLARGYLNRPGLTAERFVADEFSGSGARLYRTGDLVRWNLDGQLEYLGRIDHQVKVRGFRIELGEIESRLLEQPDVQEAVVRVQGEGDTARLVACVVPREDAIGALTASPSAERQEFVAQWEAVFESTYEGGACAPDFRGWNSSYTDQPIPESEMHEWLDCTLDRIRALGPRRILEMGCGIGLLVQKLGPDVSAYLGTDFSVRAVKDLRAWIATQPALAHVRLLRREATDFSGIDAEGFDTVVLNSVAQYFPDADYLLEVLDGAARVVGHRGQIFIGDLRHLAHRPMFHTSVQLARSASTLTIRQLKSRIQRAIAQDKELVFDPAFFHALAAHLQKGQVEVLLKRGHADNELTRYRYDVVMRPVGPAPVVLTPFDATGRDTFEALASHLRTSRPAGIGLRAVPNGRLARDLAAWRLVESSDDSTTVGELLAALDRIPRSGLDPERLWALGDELGYDVRISWSAATADGSIDAEFTERSTAQVASGPASIPSSAALNPSWRAFASDPARARRWQHLGTRLRERLLEKLPDYMVPTQIVALESLPLTVNGKLDWKMLPELAVLGAGRYQPPQNAAEQALAAIWAEVIGVERVGRDDNFFEIGGHSLVANQISMLLAQRYGCELPVRRFFESHSLADLASTLDPGAFVASRTKSQRLMEMERLLGEVELS